MEYIVIGIVVVTALAAVSWPLLRRDRHLAELADEALLEARITRYRAALKRGTVCDRCLRDNPEGARYCADCGRKLPT